MIVIGADPHKLTHTAAAVDAGIGELHGHKTAAARAHGHAELLAWARELDAERVWAIEDCRHVSSHLERFLVGHGERVVRVPPKLMGESRRGERTAGKSDPIDAQAVARAALREGVDSLPSAQLDREAHEIKLLTDHREDLVGERTRIQNRLRWHLHELWPELAIPVAALDRAKWLDSVGRRLARAEQTARVRVARDERRRLRELTRSANALEREIAILVRAKAPQLLELPGCGPLSAARLIAETAGTTLASDAKLARLAGVAPIPASSGQRRRHRLHRGGNRRLNCAIHRIAVTQGRVHGPARDYLARKQAEGKTRIEALRCLKRQLVRTLWRLLFSPTADREGACLKMTINNHANAPARALALT
jgi:transposase